MINQQLFYFVQQSLQRGSTKEKITSDLISGGWTLSDIEECFNAISSSVSINDNNIVSQKVESSSGKKVFMITLVIFLLAGAVSGYYFRNDLPIVKDLIKSKSVAINNVIQDQNLQNIANEKVDVTQNQIQQEPTAPVPSTIASDTQQSVKVISTTSPTTQTTPTTVAIGPIACGANMSCFISAAKNCSPASVEETMTISVFNMFNQTNKTTMTLTGLNSSKKCEYISRVDDATLAYSPDMVKTIQMEMDKQVATLTSQQKKDAFIVPSESLATVKSTIGTTTKCSFKPADLVNLLTKWDKGESSSNDLASGSCTLTDAKGKSMPLYTGGTSNLSVSSIQYNQTTTYGSSNATDLYLNKQTIYSNKSMSLSDIGFTLLSVTDKDDFTQIYKLSVTKIATGENQIITFGDNNSKQFKVFGLTVTYAGYEYLSKTMNNGVETTKLSVNITK